MKITINKYIKNNPRRKIMGKSLGNISYHAKSKESMMCVSQRVDNLYYSSLVLIINLSSINLVSGMKTEKNVSLSF